jgi:hypothetical protein
MINFLEILIISESQKDILINAERVILKTSKIHWQQIIHKIFTLAEANFLDGYKLNMSIMPQ